MIKRLMWTIWTPMPSVLKKADKLNLSLSLQHGKWENNLCSKMESSLEWISCITRSVDWRLSHICTVRCCYNMVQCSSWYFAQHCSDWSKINGLGQGCSNSIALAMELLQSCTKPWKYKYRNRHPIAPLWCLLWGFERKVTVLWWHCTVLSPMMVEQLFLWGANFVSGHNFAEKYRTDSGLAPSHWGTSLQNNAVSHWLCTWHCTVLPTVIVELCQWTKLFREIQGWF